MGANCRGGGRGCGGLQATGMKHQFVACSRLPPLPGGQLSPSVPKSPQSSLPDLLESGYAQWGALILPAHPLVFSTHSSPAPSGPLPIPPHPLRLWPCPLSPPLPASLPASFSARLQLGDNLPHLASRLLPRLIAQLVPGARPSFFPTPTPSPAPKLPQPLPFSLTHSQGTSCPLQGGKTGLKGAGWDLNWL